MKSSGHLVGDGGRGGPDLFERLLRRLARIGKTGAVICLGVSAVCIAASVWLSFELVLMLFGAFFGVLGLSTLLMPDWAKLAGPVGPDALPSGVSKVYGRQALLAAMADEPMPFHVCGACNALFPTGQCHGVCLRCDEIVQCYEVACDEDLSLVRTALEG